MGRGRPEGCLKPLPDSTTECVCGKKMVAVDSTFVQTSSPLKYSWYWKCFGCGDQRFGGTYWYQEVDEDFERWKVLNGED